MAASGRRVAVKTRRHPLKRIGAAYALAAALALGGGFSLAKSFEVPAAAATPIMKPVVDNSANFRNIKPDVIPDFLKRPAENIVVPVTLAAPVTPVVEYQAPDLLSIPELGVASTIVVSPLEGDRLVIPSSEYVGEYTESTPLIGTEGTTLLVGHVNFADGSPGALAPISSAKEGQLVKASDGTGKIHVYKVVDVSTYVKRALPEEVFATTGPRQLVLVTCGGPLVEVDGALAYSSNVVLTAVPVI